MTDQKKHTCCEPFRQAQDDGTTADGYGPAVMFSPTNQVWHIGVIYDAIKFCPWCGARLDDGNN